MHVWCGSVCTSGCCISCGTVWPSAQYMYGVGVFVLVVAVFHVVWCGLVHSACMVWECLY